MLSLVPPNLQSPQGPAPALVPKLESYLSDAFRGFCVPACLDCRGAFVLA